MKTIVTTMLCILCTIFLSAQYSIDLLPRISSDNLISERIAYTNIEIKYGSPKVRGREIWGELQEYDQIWRAGANMATTISFGQDVSIEGKKLEQGIYSFFVIPRKLENWTLIFNKVHDQWGAFNYDQNKDALRFEVPIKDNNYTEDLTYDIGGNDFNSAIISLAWENVLIQFHVDVQYLDILEKLVEEKLMSAQEGTGWVIYLQAAEFLVVQNQRLELAKIWLDKSSSLSQGSDKWSGQFYPRSYVMGHLYWIQAKLSALNEDYKMALAYGQKMKDIKGEYTFYDEEMEVEDINQFLDFWRKKLNIDKREKP